MAQTIICGAGTVGMTGGILHDIGTEKFLLVCDASYPHLNIRETIDALPFERAVFSEFTSNPLYEDVCRGVELFSREGCDAIVAVGGGSSIDVAKCIKLYCKMDTSENYLTQEYKDTGIPLIAIPTTAGTGSESTRFAVIYFEGKKQSVAHESIIPDFALLDPSVLGTLPLYQKKCTMLDALCQGIESWWNVNSTDESKEYAKRAVGMIVANMDAYLDGSGEAAEQIMRAANFSGRAINITQTTAPHAMSYKLTSLYGLPHGHAVAVCLPETWRFMLANPDKCADVRGKEYLLSVFDDIAKELGKNTPIEAVSWLDGLLQKLEIFAPPIKESELAALAGSVNPVRLRNHPVRADETDLYNMYAGIAHKR